MYQIVRGDTLIKIAKRNNTTVDKIMAVNPELVNRSYIVAGCYIYIPA
ncbi:MAG: LysM peptidoglycan-binding domain-containing protein [Clostridia bacterium]|nr:LysM peptidoglycan-binding domain-containing protein [Clostridia bacterium]